MKTLGRFFSKVSVSPAGCWEWLGQINHGGYGRFCLRGKKVSAHRYSYEELVGPIPSGLNIDHLCGNRSCVNPRHLEPVTQRENLMRGNTIAARNAAATHCPSGHPYNEMNTARDWLGNRVCRTCQRDHARKYRRLHRARLAGTSNLIRQKRRRV